MERDQGQKEFEKIEELVSLDGKEALEVGCGDGIVSTFLVSKVKRLTAIDPDRKALEKARQSIPGVDFRLGSGENLEFEDNCFDLVLFTLSLHHQDGKKSLKEAFRVLRENGGVVIIEPRADSIVQQVFMLFEDEKERMKKALKYIEESEFRIEKKDVFFTEWVFQDKGELYKYFFDYYETKGDKKIPEINKIVGKKIYARPIVLKDKLSIFSLKKR